MISAAHRLPVAQGPTDGRRQGARAGRLRAGLGRWACIGVLLCAPAHAASPPEAFSAPFANAFLANSVNLDFDPTTRTAREVSAGFAENLQENLPLTYALPDAVAFVREGQALAQTSLMLEDRGWPANNVATATALLLVTAWEIVHQQRLEQAQADAVLRHTVNAFQGHALTRAMDTARQEAATARLIMAGLMHAEHMAREDDALPALQEAVQAAMLRTSSNDMKALVPSTTDGLVPRR